MRWGEAALGDEEVLDGEGFGGDGCGGGEEALEGNEVGCGEMGWRADEERKNARSEEDHGVTAAPVAGGLKRYAGSGGCGG